MKLIKALILLLLPFWATCYALHSSAQITVDVRKSGYTLGDFVEVRAVLTLKENQHIDLESLPLQGRFSHWLDLRSIELVEKGNRAKLNFTWQLFGTVEVAQMIKLPEIQIKTLDKPAQIYTIPAQTIFYSPVLPASLTDIKRESDLPPLLADKETPLYRASWCAGIALLCLLLWAWIMDKIPSLPFRPGPMTKLARQLQRTEILDSSQMRNIHSALNQAASETLYPDTLHRLFIKAPYLQAEEIAITRFFNDSWTLFYQTNPQGSFAKPTWITNAALLERLYRRDSKPAKK